MLSLKKYFTEGLIQFTILLSLIGVRVDVDTYLNSQLPPLREIILGQSSAYTQTQFHNLRNTLDGYGIHPKSVDLDYYFTARRLLNQVRALDRFQVPTTEVNAWLVHRDPEGSVSGSQPSAGIALENGSGLQDGSNPDNGVRESGAEQGFGEELEDLGAVAAPVNGDLTKEVGRPFFCLWRGGKGALGWLLPSGIHPDRRCSARCGCSALGKSGSPLGNGVIQNHGSVGGLQVYVRGGFSFLFALFLV